MKPFFKTAETFVAGSMTLPQKFYVSNEVFALEKKHIFGAGWMCVGHHSRIPNDGDYFVQNIFGESLIVLRDKAGQVRAFYNVCRHRGTRICEEAEGRFHGSIQCSYHAWTYGLDGSLIGAPFMKEIENFRWEDFPLRAAPVKVWEGFIFLNIDAARSAVAFEEVFAPLEGRLSAWNMDRLKLKHRESYDIQSNWKYIFQNFNECYHCPTIHPRLNKLTNYTSAGNDLVEGQFLGGYMELTGGGSMTITGRLCAAPLGELSDVDQKRGYYYSMLPNLLLNIHPDYVMVHILFPEGPGRTRLTSEWLFHPDSFDRDDFHPEDAVDFWHETNLQDWHVCELSQLGVSSQSYSPGWYTPRESLLAAFDRHYIKIMDEE
jgi:Rieske 2Fe-2S family protein